MRRRLATLASLCLVLSPRGQEFVRVPVAVAPAPTTVRLADGMQLEHAGDALWLVTAAGRRPVPCTRLGGAGAVRGFAVHPHGTVFVAAEHGLFVLDAEHPVLDPMDRRDGVPAGAPRSLCVDADGRLWLCTDAAFGVVDPRFGFGRTLTAADGLPAGPFLALGQDPTGRILLATAAGTFAYTPDVGPPPRRTDAGPLRRAVVAGADGAVVVELTVEARGGASLRHRRQHHHLLQPMVGNRLLGLRPGRHVVEVQAIDRDLRRIVVAIYDVHVPLAPVLDPRLLPLLAAGAGALLFVLAWRRSPPGRLWWRRLAAAAGNAALVAVCGLQVLAALLGYGRSWPFVGFTMYTETWRQDDVLHKPRLTGLLADGTRIDGAEHEAAVLQDGYWQMLAEVLHGGGDAHRALLQRWNAGRHAGLPRLAGFRLVDGRIRLSAAGPVDVAPTVLVHHEAR